MKLAYLWSSIIIHYSHPIIFPYVLEARSLRIRDGKITPSLTSFAKAPGGHRKGLSHRTVPPWNFSISAMIFWGLLLLVDNPPCLDHVSWKHIDSSNNMNNNNNNNNNFNNNNNNNNNTIVIIRRILQWYHNNHNDDYDYNTNTIWT